MKKALLFGVLMSLLSIQAYATDIDFTYNVKGSNYLIYGFGKRETYNVAILIPPGEFTGARVKGISVGFPVDDTCYDGQTLSAWLSSSLKADNGVNEPDICSTKASVNEDFYLEASFDNPYTIPESGVYVGYTFTITNVNSGDSYPDNPIACIYNPTNYNEGMWVMTSSSNKTWTNFCTQLGAVSTMVVHLDTDFGPHDVAVALTDNVYITRGKESTIPVTLISHTNSPISDITYSYTIGDVAGTGSAHFDEPLDGAGKAFSVELGIEPYEDLGKYEFQLNLETTNGGANADPGRSASSMMNVQTVVPVNRPLVEEFTGLNCGYCPRGYVALEEMNKQLGDKFVALAYHSQSYESQMVTVKNSDFPISVPGFPAADINRNPYIDPADIPEQWSEYAAVVPPMNIDVESEWADENHTEMVAKATVTFANTIPNANYKLTFALVADNLHNSTWRQSNYYSGLSTGDGIESDLWDIFLKGGRSVSGLIFNDVVAYYKDIKGITGSIPTSVEEGQVVTYEYRFPIADVKTISGKDFLNEDAKLHVVAAVLDGKTGRSVNCNKSKNLPLSTSAVEGIASDAEVVNTMYYNMQGVRVEKPSKGIYFRVEILSDGSRRTVKELIH